jgi:hypothetical protein
LTNHWIELFGGLNMQSGTLVRLKNVEKGKGSKYTEIGGRVLMQLGYKQQISLPFSNLTSQVIFELANLLYNIPNDFTIYQLGKP